MNGRLASVRILREHDIVEARRRARQIAEALGFDAPEQTRIATAVSELAQNAFQYGRGGSVDYFVEGSFARQLLIARVSDEGPGIRNLEDVLSGRYRSATGRGLGLPGARRLMDAFDAKTGPAGTTVTVKKIFPSGAPVLNASQLERVAARLLAEPPAGPIEEVQQQNHELVRTLEELRARQDELERVNRELEDTNRGVVALYGELEERTDHLRRSADLKTRFLSNMTHEFRTPVNSILALTGLLTERLGASLEQKDELFYIRKSAQQLSELVDDLLDIAKVEAGKIDIHPAPFEVDALFGALRGMLRPLLLNQSLALVFEDPDGIPPLFSDESKVSQILRNFISNALKYTERGEVRVSARLTARRDGVVFAVSDTGIGIPERDVPRVFEEFVQIENPLQRRVKGTGLGLPLSKRLAELLGGSIAVKSSLGSGSTFSVTIPIVYKAAGQTAIASGRLEMLAPQRRVVRVLTIDDEETYRFIVREMLNDSSYVVTEAGAGIEGLRLAHELVPDIVLLDLRLTDMTGIEMCERLRRDPKTAHVPVILVTSQMLSPGEREQLGVGRPVLSKSALTRDALRTAIDDTLGQPRANQREARA